ncbi:MAG TPA: ATPase [Clostridiaceae bacterium]|jgi:hypothetical protein|nr:ATPase [Clostridiaceae bacterium]
MVQGKVKRLFPGGNTARGFFSYYDYILSQEEADRIIVIKGGPGVGKSTLMKKVAAEMIKKGLDVELMHCSSDPASLDGVVIHKAGTAIIDGTKPHIVDPKNPGAVDEILNLGEFWDHEGVRSNRIKILKCNNEIARFFERAYRYIRAAYEIYKDSEEIYSHAMDHQKVNKIANNIMDNLFADDKPGDIRGKWRKMFASAITPQGLVNYLQTVLTTSKIYKIKGLQGTGTEKLLNKIAAAAVECGCDVECYYCALNPEKLEHVVIPQKDVSFTTANCYHNADIETFEEINLNEFIDLSMLDVNESDIEFNNDQFDHLLGRAIETIKKAKEKHDELEQYYVPNMKFDEIHKKTDEIIKKILKCVEPSFEI